MHKIQVRIDLLINVYPLQIIEKKNKMERHFSFDSNAFRFVFTCRLNVERGPVRSCSLFDDGSPGGSGDTAPETASAS